jgi:hypothetical protein
VSVLHSRSSQDNFLKTEEEDEEEEEEKEEAEESRTSIMSYRM